MSTRTPIYVTCTGCRRQVLEVRWDHHQDILLEQARLDPVSLDHQQITACIIAEISLWQLHEHAGEPITSHRTRWWPRRRVPGHVLPEHACGRTWDAFPINLAPDPTLYPDTPPF